MFGPELAALLVSVGILAVCWEFCHPGQVLPGVAGAVAIALGLASLYRTGLPHWTWVAATAVPPLVVVSRLLRIARRARIAKQDWQSARLRTEP